MNAHIAASDRNEENDDLRCPPTNEDHNDDDPTRVGISSSIMETTQLMSASLPQQQRGQRCTTTTTLVFVRPPMTPADSLSSVSLSSAVIGAGAGAGAGVGVGTGAPPPHHGGPAFAGAPPQQGMAARRDAHQRGVFFCKEKFGFGAEGASGDGNAEVGEDDASSSSSTSSASCGGGSGAPSGESSDAAAADKAKKKAKKKEMRKTTTKNKKKNKKKRSADDDGYDSGGGAVIVRRSSSSSSSSTNTNTSSSCVESSSIRVRTLRSEVQSLQADLSDSRSECRRRSALLAVVTAERDGALDQIESHRRRSSVMRAQTCEENEALRDECAKLVAERDELMDKIREGIEERGGLRKSVNELRFENDRLAEDADQVVTVIDALRDQLRRKNEEEAARRLESDLNAAQLESARNDAEVECRNARREMEGMRRKMERMEREVEREREELVRRSEGMAVLVDNLRHGMQRAARERAELVRKVRELSSREEEEGRLQGVAEEDMAEGAAENERHDACDCDGTDSQVERNDGEPSSDRGHVNKQQNERQGNETNPSRRSEGRDITTKEEANEEEEEDDGSAINDAVGTNPPTPLMPGLDRLDSMALSVSSLVSTSFGGSYYPMVVMADDDDTMGRIGSLRIEDIEEANQDKEDTDADRGCETETDPGEPPSEYDDDLLPADGRCDLRRHPHHRGGGGVPPPPPQDRDRDDDDESEWCCHSHRGTIPEGRPSYCPPDEHASSSASSLQMDSVARLEDLGHASMGAVEHVHRRAAAAAGRVAAAISGGGGREEDRAGGIRGMESASAIGSGYLAGGGGGGTPGGGASMPLLEEFCRSRSEREASATSGGDDLGGVDAGGMGLGMGVGRMGGKGRSALTNLFALGGGRRRKGTFATVA